MKNGLKSEEKRTSYSKTEIAEKYQYLVGRIAEKFKNVSKSRENLEEVGYIGLLNAVNLYDKNVHQMDFETYARNMITEEMHQYLMNYNRKMDRPDWLIRLNQRIDKFVIQYQERYQCFPQISEIVSHLNIDPSGLQEVLKARDSLRESYLLRKVGQHSDFFQIQPRLEKIKSHSYQSFRLPIEDLITLRKAFRRLKV
jgi:RNA polymerase sigma-B factor